ncbi:hypothetical protein [Bosea sp. NBC_00550]|nr:hypothetical protein [Bosea sp. NBC_00550]UZF93209.1 hypothetical protein NWE53_03060 [Bosea sp. NBC_00550]
MTTLSYTTLWDTTAEPKKKAAEQSFNPLHRHVGMLVGFEHAV